MLLSQMMTEQAQLEAETKRSQGAGGEKPPIPLLHLVKQLLRWVWPGCRCQGTLKRSIAVMGTAAGRAGDRRVSVVPSRLYLYFLSEERAPVTEIVRAPGNYKSDDNVNVSVPFHGCSLSEPLRLP